MLLVTTYDLGHRSQLAALLEADLADRLRVVEGEAPAAIMSSEIRSADWVVVTAPMLTGALIAEQVLVEHAEELATRHVILVGAYATTTLEAIGHSLDGIIALDRDDPELVLCTIDPERPLRRGGRRHYRITTSEPLDRYRHAERDGRWHLAAYAETTLGCRHSCLHCPVAGAWRGRIVTLDAADVLADIDRQVAAGASHLSLGDADFLSAPRHALGILSAVHERHPSLSVDVTIKISELAADPSLPSRLADLGVAFVISAVESLRNDVLDRLGKGHHAEDVFVARDALFAAGVGLHPTFIPFTPWSSLEDLYDILRFVWDSHLEDVVEPVQYGIELLVPTSSLLELDAAFGEFDPVTMSRRWRPRDPRLEGLATRIRAIAARPAPYEQGFRAVWELAGLGALPARGPRRAPTPTLMSEAWFCCAAPPR